MAVEDNDLTSIKYLDFIEDAIKFKSIVESNKKVYSLVSINSQKRITYEN